MTQSDLAERSSTTQSAISMFESGRTDALADDKLRAVAEILGIDLDTREALDAHALAQTVETKYCPTPDCPCNAPYLVSGQLCVLITPVSAPAGEATRCRLCGEVMESHCPNTGCRAPVARGAFCCSCGHAYITAAPGPGQSVDAWVHAQRQSIRELKQLAENTAALTRGKATPCPPPAHERAPHDVV